MESTVTDEYDSALLSIEHRRRASKYLAFATWLRLGQLYISEAFLFL